MDSAQSNLTIIWVVIFCYIAIIAAAGSYYARFMKSADAYFKAGNQIPWWAAGISMYMANFTAYTFVGIASMVYMRGMPALLLETGPALAFAAAAIFLAPRWYRLNITSPPEYLEQRFNPLTRHVFSILGILARLIGNGIRLFSMSKFIESVTGIPTIYMIVITGVIVIFYTVLGGLWAVIVTDVLQFVVLMLAVIPMLIVSVASIFFDATWSEFVSAIPQGFASFPNTNPDAAYPGVPVEAGPQWAWLIVFWFSYLLDYNGDWGVIQRMCCTPSERDAKKAAWLSAALSVPHAFLLLGTCFIARVLWAGELADPTSVGESEMIYGLIATKLLPAGLVGIVVAAMFSATMSTLNVQWAVQSTSFVNDIWTKLVNKAASDREQILVGRAAVVVIGGVGTTVALAIALTETDIFGFAQSMVALVVTPLLIPLLLGVLLPRTHQHGAIAGLFGTFMFGAINKILQAQSGGISFEFAGSAFVLQAIPFQWEVPLSAGVCLAIMGGSGMLPRSRDAKARDAVFYDRMQHARTENEDTATVPPPLPIIGTFLLLIGGLVLILVLAPQERADRLVTLGAAVTLFAVGFWMRRSRSDSVVPGQEGKP